MSTSLKSSQEGLAGAPCTSRRSFGLDFSLPAGCFVLQGALFFLTDHCLLSMLQRENVMKLNDKSHELLRWAQGCYLLPSHVATSIVRLFPDRLLVAILKESQNVTAIAVAAHDLGEYVRYYPRGKRYVCGEEGMLCAEQQYARLLFNV